MVKSWLFRMLREHAFDRPTLSTDPPHLATNANLNPNADTQPQPQSAEKESRSGRCVGQYPVCGPFPS